MPDPNATDPTTSPDAIELATLRKVNAELLQAKHTLKARIATLESELATLDSRAEKAESTLKKAIIDAPLRRLAEGIAHVPQLFLAELAKDFDVSVDADSGELRLLTKSDGKVVTNNKGVPVEMTHNALYTLLAGSQDQQKDDARKKTFATLLKYSGASGGAGRKPISSPLRSSVENSDQAVAPQFGLR